MPKWLKTAKQKILWNSDPRQRRDRADINFGCRIDINAIPTANVGFSGTANALACKPEVPQIVPTPANYKWWPKLSELQAT
jgi:hypothetical protein